MARIDRLKRYMQSRAAGSGWKRKRVARTSETSWPGSRSEVGCRAAPASPLVGGPYARHPADTATVYPVLYQAQRSERIGPIVQSDGHGGPGLGFQLAPGIAAVPHPLPKIQ
jgi:hypothetical protein